MLIKFIINLVEALIVSYSLSRLCHVKKQKLYFVLNTLMTFSIEIISDYFDANYAPLAIAYIICWNILLLFFAYLSLPLQHFLNFLPLPHGHGEFTPVLDTCRIIYFHRNIS